LHHLNLRRKEPVIFKKLLTFTMSLSLLVLSVSGFGCGAGEAADPEGTIDLTINYTSTPGGMTLLLWQGTDEDPDIATPVQPTANIPPCPPPGGGLCDAVDPATEFPQPIPVYPLSQLYTGIRDSSLNFSFRAIGSLADGTVETDDPTGGEIADVGNVDGLGAVLEKPAMGWTTLGAVEVGHGYVARFRHSRNYADTSLPYFYARLYVTGWVLDVNDGMIGAKVKYQLPF
jgi:hypothetical protein